MSWQVQGPRGPSALGCPPKPPCGTREVMEGSEAQGPLESARLVGERVQQGMDLRMRGTSSEVEGSLSGQRA